MLVTANCCSTIEQIASFISICSLKCWCFKAASPKPSEALPLVQVHQRSTSYSADAWKGPMTRSSARNSPRIDYKRLATAALPHLPQLLPRWLSNGRRQGQEWVALNPRRDDAHPGSFKVNMRTGRWADFATGDKGGDVISLAAYLFDLSQAEAARRVAQMLGFETGELRHG